MIRIAISLCLCEMVTSSPAIALGYVMRKVNEGMSAIKNWLLIGF